MAHDTDHQSAGEVGDLHNGRAVGAGDVSGELRASMLDYQSDECRSRGGSDDLSADGFGHVPQLQTLSRT
jgi:hypothetical protein